MTIFTLMDQLADFLSWVLLPAVLYSIWVVRKVILRLVKQRRIVRGALASVQFSAEHRMKDAYLLLVQLLCVGIATTTVIVPQFGWDINVDLRRVLLRISLLTLVWLVVVSARRKEYYLDELDRRIALELLRGERSFDGDQP